jgi:hypothetical protein
VAGAVAAPVLVGAASIGAIEDAVLDAALADHAGAGSVGAGISAAGSAGDPWTTPLPGGYAPGTAGAIVGTNLDAKVSEVGGGTPPTVDEIADEVQTRTIAAVTGVTNPVTIANAADVTAIKAKTDQMTFTVALKVDATAEATVDEEALASAISAAVVAALGGSAEVTLLSPVLDGGSVVLTQGDDYLAADGRALSWSSTAWPDLTGATIRFGAKHRVFTADTVAATGAVVSASSARVELPASVTDSLRVGQWGYMLEATLSTGHVVTLASGRLHVLEDLIPVAP